METGSKKSSIIVPLDAILDTRLGTLAVINHTYPAKALANGYLTRNHNRLWELVDGLDETTFTEAYASRDVATLQQTVVTNIFTFLREAIGQKVEQELTRGAKIAVHVIINLAPYSLTDDERNCLHRLVSAKLGDIVEVTLGTISVADLTPKYLKGKVDAVVLSDLKEWLTVHSESFSDTQIPGIEVFAPMALDGTVSELKEQMSQFKMNEQEKAAITPFQICEEYLAPAMGLHFIPLQFYTISERGINGEV